MSRTGAYDARCTGQEVAVVRASAVRTRQAANRSRDPVLRQKILPLIPRFPLVFPSLELVKNGGQAVGLSLPTNSG